MNYYRELIKLRGKCNRLLQDHKTPIDQTTNEQHELIGYDRALAYMVKEITNILEAGDKQDMMNYTE